MYIGEECSRSYRTTKQVSALALSRTVTRALHCLGPQYLRLLGVLPPQIFEK